MTSTTIATTTTASSAAPDTGVGDLGPITSFSGPYAFLSNFHRVPGGVLYEGVRYPTTEYGYQAQKTADRRERIKIAELVTASEAKAYGRRINIGGRRRADWFDVNMSIMAELQEIKYKEPELREKLRATKGRALIEGNSRCDIWFGMCKCPKHRRPWQELKDGEWPGIGENWLGQIIESVRDGL